MANFNSTFISECVNKNILSMADICEEGKKQFNDLDKQITELRIKKNDLSNFLKQFNESNTDKNNDQNKIVEVSEELQNQVCKYLKTHTNVKAGNLVDALGGYSEQTKIYSAIKRLGEKDVIERDENGFIIPGMNWS